MSTIDDARDKTYTRNLMFFGLNSTEMEVVKLFLEAQEQEIARLQNQLATARDGLVRLARFAVPSGTNAYSAIERINEIALQTLAAIPIASDCELLLEEARAICDAISGMEYNSLVSRTLRQVTELIPKARALRAKLPK